MVEAEERKKLRRKDIRNKIKNWKLDRKGGNKKSKTDKKEKERVSKIKNGK